MAELTSWQKRRSLVGAKAPAKATPKKKSAKKK